MHEWTKDEAQIIKACWASDAGRLALSIIVERLAGLHGASFSPDALKMAFGEGRRSIGIDLMRAINLPQEKLIREDTHEPARVVTATERAGRSAGSGRTPRTR